MFATKKVLLQNKSVLKPVVQAIAVLALGTSFQSCQEKAPAPTPSSAAAVSNLETNSLQKTFAKGLAVALKNEPELRTFLKEEANKQFDGDYDILYQFVKDKPVNGKATFREILVKYLGTTQLEAIEDRSPLLTIFIPNLPSGFSPQTWNALTDAPAIAVRLQGSNSIPFFNSDGKEDLVHEGQIPGFPTLVIKQNERVGLSSLSSNSSELAFFRDGKNTYYFGDKVFDGRNATNQVSKTGSSKGGNNRFGQSFQFDPKVINAYNLNGIDRNVQWQRDYVYYGINPSTPNGSLDQNYKEFIHTIKFSKDALGFMADQQGDPTTIKLGKVSEGFWTEGRFEIQISVLINAKNGIGPKFSPVISVNPTDLYDIKYKTVFFQNIYQFEDVIPKEFKPDIPLTAWDLSNVSTAWLFVVTERDASGTDKKTYVNNSSMAANFDINFPAPTTGPVKVGAKLGLSASTSSTVTHEVTFNFGDDDLGPTILEFKDPIINSMVSPAPLGSYNTYEINNGPNGYYSMSIEPRVY